MNVNGYCQKCNADFDDELVFETFLKQGHQPEKAVKYCESVSGYKERGMFNRWSRLIISYSLDKDRMV